MIYRVTIRTTGSLQPSPQETYWSHEVLYCGDDLHEARIAYHRSSPNDYAGSYGNRAQETVFEVLDEDDLEDDEAGEMSVADIEDYA